MKILKADPVISQFFHQSGVSFIYNGKHDISEKFFEKVKTSAEKAESMCMTKLIYLNSNEEVFESVHGSGSITPNEIILGRETWWNKGYRNLSDGFIDAELSMKAYYERAKTYPNIKFTFNEVESLVYFQGTNKFRSVAMKNGQEYFADLVIVAAGAWSGKLVNLQGMCTMSAIEVGWFKLSAEEVAQWKNMSITNNFSVGFNLFPPYNDEIKVLRRSPGYKNTIEIENPNPLENDKISISYPRTTITNPTDWMPKDAEDSIRENLKEIIPPLYKRPFDRTKLCWLTQTPKANFLIDYHPECENVLLATGGSAHAWKFVPIIGDKVVDFMEGNLDPRLVEMWSWREKFGSTTDKVGTLRMKGQSQEIKNVIRRSPKIKSQY